MPRYSDKEHLLPKIALTTIAVTFHCPRWRSVILNSRFKSRSSFLQSSSNKMLLWNYVATPQHQLQNLPKSMFGERFIFINIVALLLLWNHTHKKCWTQLRFACYGTLFMNNNDNHANLKEMRRKKRRKTKCYDKKLPLTVAYSS